MTAPASPLTLARKRRGLTTTRLAELSGLTRRTITNYETGHRIPPPAAVKLADILGVRPEFLTSGEIDEIPVGAASFRALSRMTARQREGALAAGRMAILINEWIQQHFTLPEPDLPTLTGYLPEEAADTMRARWGLGEKPISNTLHLLESHGVRVFSLAQEHHEVDAFSVFFNGTPYVFLSQEKSAERGRFDLCHELGHLVLHREHGCNQGPDKEQEANDFASAFLMPRASVLAHSLRNATVQQILQKKTVWKVAAMALTRRLYVLGLLTEWGYRQTCIELARMGYRRSEPGGIARESSQLLTKVLASLRSDGQSPTQIAADIGLTTDEFNKHIFHLTMTPAVSGGEPRSRPRRPDLAVVHRAGK